MEMQHMQTLVKRPSVILKLVETVLTIICAAIVGESATALYADNNYVVSVAIHGYIIIHFISLASYILKTPLHKFINMGIAVVGAVMTFAAGGIMLSTYNSWNSLKVFDYLLAAGIIAFINGGAYLAEVFFLFRETTVSS